MDDPQEVTNLIQGAINAFDLCRRTDDERNSSDLDKQQKYKSGNILGTLQAYEQEIATAKKQQSSTHVHIPSSHQSLRIYSPCSKGH
eukprot:10261147-Ditylum_brightwellii.AAC.1